MDIRDYNREAWNAQVRAGNQWTVPVTTEAVDQARAGQWTIRLTPTKPVPADWFGDLTGRRVLCLASGGGQQGPILAAAGAQVTVFDNSPAQLGQDRLVAEREGLSIETVEGDMADLSAFADETFDVIFHPCSNCFVPDVKPVWREAFRVCRDGGRLLAGFSNAVMWLFDYQKLKAGEVDLRYSVPYSDLTSLTDEERQVFIDENEPLCFGHSLDDQLGGQIAAGFAITGFFEDEWPDDEAGQTLSRYMPSFIGTLARRFAL